MISRITLPLLLSINILLINPVVSASLHPGFDLPISRPCPCYRNWFALFYIGKMTNNTLGQILSFDFTFDKDTLYSLEIGREFDACNPLRQFLQPILSTVDFRVNFTFLDDTYGHIYEINPYLGFDWNSFPWCQKLKTTLTLGEGLSYVSKVPYTEELNSDQPKRLLNFLLFELAIAIPSYPQWECVVRIHHRSGVFGLYHANNAGSTAVGLAIRYRFGFPAKSL